MDLRREITLSDLVPKGFMPLRRAPKPVARRPIPKELVGLRIDSGGISAAQVANSSEKELVQVVRTPLEPGIVQGGEVRDPAALGAALADLFASTKLPRRGVRLGIGNSRIGVRVVEVAATDDRQQLDNMIRFRAHEMISASLDDVLIDYQPVGEGRDADGNPTRRIILVIAYRDSVDRYLAATDAASLGVVGIDLEAFALLRATAAPRPSSEPLPALVAVSVDHERTTLAVSDGSACHFTRVIDWGEASIDAAVSRALALPASEAAPLWRAHFAGVFDEAEAAESREARARSIATHELMTLVRELQSSLRFYQSQPGALPVEVVHLTGGLTDVPGVCDELRRALGIGLAVVDPFNRFAPSGERPEHPGDLSVALGLGIED